jgi:hypothetical protein
VTVDDLARTKWRERLAISYPWLCNVCKMGLEDQARLAWQRGYELIRHSECGHVIAYKTGGLDNVRQFVDEWKQTNLDC